MNKTCGKCKLSKPTSEFWKHSHGYLHSVCKVCHTVMNRRWVKEHPEKVKKYQRKWRQKSGNAYFKEKNACRRYGITLADKRAMLEAHGGNCAICLIPLAGREQHIDHSHTTKKVRGVLCRACNFGLGYFRDNVAVLLRAISYLNIAENGSVSAAS